MRTTATYTLTTTSAVARDLVAAHLVGEGLRPELEEDWDGSALWGSCALRVAITDGSQDYVFDVHIRDLGAVGEPRCGIELRQQVLGYRGTPVGPRRSLVAVEHLGDALRSALEQHGVVAHVEQFS